MNTLKRRGAFISYSRRDKDFAVALAKELRSAGALVWLDQLDIPTGARWDDEVEKALREHEIFLIILTPASVSSENVKDEIGYAIDHGKHIMPVLLEKCDIPLRLSRFQYIDFTKIEFGEGIRRAKHLLEDLLNEQSKPIGTISPEFERQEFFNQESIPAQPSPKKKKPVMRRWVGMVIGAVIISLAICIGVLGILILSKGLNFPGISTQSPTASTSMVVTSDEIQTNISPSTQIPTDTEPITEEAQAPPYKPMWESSAIITDLNGDQTTIPADTLRWCSSVGENIFLDNGYTIALDTIRRIDIVRAAPVGGKTLFSIILLDGTTIEGEDLTCSFIGQTSTGRFELWTDQIQSVEILR